MKQKVVIKVALNDQKCRTKAIKTAVGIDGVIQATLQQEKNQIEVTGDDIDVVLLTTLLRKCLKYAEVVSVSPIDKEAEEKKKKEEEEKKKKEEEEKKNANKFIYYPYSSSGSCCEMPQPGYVSYSIPYQEPSAPCSIM
ncbi:heavy metal-associated isoprenylated plant protein 16 [Humulus lupulus]|uniref:heavy metal-associated isoprenylated plant protein 16 n=1 Tax=Humulus lupulus TaxID=3486 RepID=UPI002B4124E9|nr:heavy metal-associated isoprenylated plant protein 16 [Humulus lupulus]